MSDPQLHITVVAFTGKGLDMTDELALVKAALLYADRVTLASPSVIAIASLASYLVASPAERKDLVAKILSMRPPTAGFTERREFLRAKKHRTKKELLDAMQIERELNRGAVEWEAIIARQLEEANAGELSLALEAGLLELDALGADDNDEAYSPAGITRSMAALIEEILGPSSATYPMFSELTGGLARAMVKEGKIAGAELAPATQAGVAGRFISAIDAFPDAPMDVVLDARGQLRNPLRRFRAGVSRLSRELAATGIDALDPRFERAAADLYRDHVALAIEEIEELSRELGLRNALLRTSPTVARDVALATMALVATTGGGVGELATLAVGATGEFVGRTAIRQRELREKRDTNEFVFLYEAEKRLGS